MDLSALTNLAHQASSNTVDHSPERKILTVNVDDVVSKTQHRKRFKNIKELSQSIESDGQQSPIIVRPINNEGKYVIQKGERRWRACKLLKNGTIDILVNQENQSLVEEAASELIENIQREDLDHIEIAGALQTLKSGGWKATQIASYIGKSKSYVSKYMALCDLPECISALNDNDLCSDTDTFLNLKKLYELDKERCEVVCSNAFQEEIPITRKESKDLLIIAKEPQPKPTGETIKEKPGKPSKGRNKMLIKTKIMVSFLAEDGQPQTGYILQNRINEDPHMICIQLETGESREVPASHLSVLRLAIDNG
ncbi:putative chromosome-partitioning protein ParB [invertebrate metagenome]|uniref:Putative chromosome-partitioning protein ParB n=1 Tax=invertebrate metagenome TaxID=1711999 RepID=A0A2H9T523_9ZZZZ